MHKSEGQTQQDNLTPNVGQEWEHNQAVNRDESQPLTPRPQPDFDPILEDEEEGIDFDPLFDENRTNETP